MVRGPLAILGVVLIASGLFTAALIPAAPVLAQDSASAPKAKKKGLKGSIGYRRAYSYSKSTVVGTETRRFTEPGYSRQTTSGPFDNGFFFDSAIGRNGGEAPYQQ